MECDMDINCVSLYSQEKTNINTYRVIRRARAAGYDVDPDVDEFFY
jgi:hypothetical protein